MDLSSPTGSRPRWHIDGLSFDEVLLGGLVPGIVTVLVTRYLTRRTRRRFSDPASDRPRAYR